jgi:hypothetical protein
MVELFRLGQRMLRTVASLASLAAVPFQMKQALSF